VRRLRQALDAAGLRRVQAGTVDKFQGREAAVVFYSLATSSAEDVPRGLEFLFSRNRLNVAVSRARCLAYVVASPRLLESRARTVDQMRDLLVQHFRSEVELVGPAHRTKIDECFGEAGRIAERLEDAVEADERRDVDFALHAIIKPDEEAITAERSNFHDALDHRHIIPGAG